MNYCFYLDGLDQHGVAGVLVGLEFIAVPAEENTLRSKRKKNKFKKIMFVCL